MKRMLARNENGQRKLVRIIKENVSNHIKFLRWCFYAIKNNFVKNKTFNFL